MKSTVCIDVHDMLTVRGGKLLQINRKIILMQPQILILTFLPLPLFSQEKCYAKIKKWGPGRKNQPGAYN